MFLSVLVEKTKHTSSQQAPQFEEFVSKLRGITV